MNIAIGVGIGAVVGAATLFFLLRFIKQLSLGEGFALYGLLQFFLPFAALLLVGLLYTAALLAAGITVAAVLAVGSIARVAAEKSKNSDKNAAPDGRDED